MTVDIPRGAKRRFVDKGELRRLVTEANARMGIVPVENATGEMVQQMMLERGIRPEDNVLSSELIRLQYERVDAVPTCLWDASALAKRYAPEAGNSSEQGPA